jgi:hypothetical protein
MTTPKETSAPRTMEEIYQDALRLSSEEREKLVGMLDQDENSGWTSLEIKQAWIEECDRRVQLVKDGKAGWVDGEPFMRDLRQSLAE